MQLQTKHYYDDETMEFVGARWFIDGEEVGFDEYMDVIGALEDKDEDCDECNNDENEAEECEGCEISCEQCRDISIVEKFASEIENADCDCGACLRNTLYELLMVGKSIGWDDCKECTEEKSDITYNFNINIDNMNNKEDIANYILKQIPDKFIKLGR